MSQVTVNNGRLPVAPAGKSIRGLGDYHPRARAQVFGALQNFLGGLMVSYLVLLGNTHACDKLRPHALRAEQEGPAFFTWEGS